MPILDKEVRRVYWYYLRSAVLLYQANIDTPERFISFFIYRNTVGTFLCIASWYKSTQTSEINTFVRLGNGYSKDVENIYSPVDIDPFVISLRLSEGELLLELTEDGQFKISGPGVLDINKEGTATTVTQELIDAKIKCTDKYVRDTYWYYLRDAKLVNSESIATTQRIYAVLTYINIVGTFLVIGSCNSEEIVQINTFVRLGAGSTGEIRPIKIEPTVVSLA